MTHAMVFTGVDLEQDDVDRAEYRAKAASPASPAPDSSSSSSSSSVAAAAAGEAEDGKGKGKDKKEVPARSAKGRVPLRFRIENSWGEKNGDKGYYSCRYDRPAGPCLSFLLFPLPPSPSPPPPPSAAEPSRPPFLSRLPAARRGSTSLCTRSCCRWMPCPRTWASTCAPSSRRPPRSSPCGTLWCERVLPLCLPAVPPAALSRFPACSSPALTPLPRPLPSPPQGSLAQ